MRQLGLALTTGYVLVFFSERLFWSTFRPGDSLVDYLVTWLAYSVLAYLLLATVSVFRVRHVYAVFVAGAVYGWLVEGGIAATLYGTEASAPFPLCLLCTAVSWHAPISVLVGWYLARRVLDRNDGWRTLALATGIGLFWGWWAPFLWAETPPVVTPIASFLASACAMTALLVLSYWASERLGRRGFRPTWLGLTVCVAVVGLFYVQHMIALGVGRVVILPLLLVAGCAVLMRYLTACAPPEPTTPAPSACTARNYLALMATPVVATGAYSVAMLVGPGAAKVHVAIWWASIVLGGALLAWSATMILISPARKTRCGEAETQ